jgi:hypothetical protein
MDLISRRCHLEGARDGLAGVDAILAVVGDVIGVGGYVMDRRARSDWFWGCLPGLDPGEGDEDGA